MRRKPALNSVEHDELFSRAWRSDDPADADAYDAYMGFGKSAQPEKTNVRARKPKSKARATNRRRKNSK